MGLTVLLAVMVTASVASFGLALVEMLPLRSRSVSRRVAEIAAANDPYGAGAKRRRQAKRERFEGYVRELGEWVEKRRPESSGLQQRMEQAGFRRSHAVPMFYGSRLVLTGGLATGGMLAAAPVAPSAAMLLAIAGAISGWILPSFYLDRKVAARRHALQLAMPDMLDTLVVCVEAGLGMNQALVRVGDDIRHISPQTADELLLTNLEIRAGMPREEALRHLAQRTGLEDLHSVTTMLIQSDRFGTSLAQALRVSSDTLRVKRRQRAEERAAKTTVKMVFPLVLCIFPALLVVILAPAAIQIYEFLMK